MEEMNNQISELQQMLQEQIGKKPEPKNGDFSFVTAADENVLQQQVEELQKSLGEKEGHVNQLENDKNDISNLCKKLKSEMDDIIKAEEQLRSQINQLENTNYRLQEGYTVKDQENHDLALKIKKLELKVRQLQLIKVKDYERQLGSLVNENRNLKSRMGSSYDAASPDSHGRHQPNQSMVEPKGPLLSVKKMSL